MNPNPPSAPDAKTPTAIEVLRFCADVAPDFWFPSVFSRQAGIDRESLNEPVWMLVKAGLVSVADWTKGRGQGFSLTPAGLQMLADPSQLPEMRSLANSHRPGSDPVHEATLGLTAYDRGEITRAAFLSPRPSIVAPAILFACLVWFLIGGVVAWRVGSSVATYLREGDIKILLRIGAISGPELLRGEWWRLLSAGFVHVGTIHLLVNLFALSVIGPIAENLWGRWRFALLYVLSGVGAAAAAAAIHPHGVTAGASGSIWGLIIAVLAWLLRYRDHLPPAIVSEWLRRFVLVIGVNAVLSLTPGVSWEGHLFGGVVGLFAGLFLDWTRPGARRRKVAAGAIGLVAVLVGIVGALLVISYSTPDWKNLRTPPEPIQVARPPVANTALTAEVNSLVNALHPARLRRLQQSLVIATVNPNGNADKSTREQLQLLRNDADMIDKLLLAMTAESRAKMQTYLNEVRASVSLIEVRLNAARLPSAEQGEQLDAQFTRAEHAWAALTTK